MNDWQPIKTAPRNTEIIVYCPANEPTVFTAECDGPDGRCQCSVEGRYAPADDFFGDAPKVATHWMPLPRPPR